MDGTEMAFMNFAGGVSIPWKLAETCLHSEVAISICKSIKYSVSQFTDGRKRAAWGYIRPQFDPMGLQGAAWIEKARTLAGEWTKTSGIKVAIVGQSTVMLDIRSLVYRIFPWMILATTVIVLVVLVVAFRSVVVALRSALCAGLTLLFAGGICCLTYQGGIFEWTHLGNMTSQFGAIIWCIPVMAFNIVVGLCLDYDLFLFLRATEFRMSGMDPVTATRQALVHTGSVITTAGIMMVIAFAGLLWSSMLNAAELSLYIIATVIYDTFVMRCLFMPAIMSLMGRWNWWPSKLTGMQFSAESRKGGANKFWPVDSDSRSESGREGEADQETKQMK